MAGYAIAAIAAVLPLLLGLLRLGRPRIVVTVGGIVAFGWLIALMMKPPPESDVIPPWFLAGMVVLLFAIWCGGLWLGVRLRKARLRRSSPG